jgi:hypothetical protein
LRLDDIKPSQRTDRMIVHKRCSQRSSHRPQGGHHRMRTYNKPVNGSSRTAIFSKRRHSIGCSFPVTRSRAIDWAQGKMANRVRSATSSDCLWASTPKSIKIKMEWAGPDPPSSTGTARNMTGRFGEEAWRESTTQSSRSVNRRRPPLYKDEFNVAVRQSEEAAGASKIFRADSLTRKGCPALSRQSRRSPIAQVHPAEVFAFSPAV